MSYSLPIFLFIAGLAAAQEPTKARPGLTREQSTQAVKVSEAAVKGLRDKLPVADDPKADRREYVVGVEVLSEKEAAALKSPTKSTKALVTTYRYFDDTTILTTVDLATGKAVDVQTAQHMRTQLSDEEYLEAQKLAREQVADVKLIYAKIGEDDVDVFPQFSQYAPDGSETIHRVVHLTYRVKGRDLSAPKPMVDLTARTVEVRKPVLPDAPK